MKHLLPKENTNKMSFLRKLNLLAIIETYLKKRFEEDSYSDCAVLAFHHAWERGYFKPPKQGNPPFSKRRVRLAEKRRKRFLEEEARDRWAEKMRKKAERKKTREAKALAEQQALEAMKGSVSNSPSTPQQPHQSASPT